VTELEKRRARVPGGELAYLDLGDPEAPPVLMLHGFPTSSHLWRNLAPLLSPWMRVVAPDLLGCGDSPAEAGAELHIRAQARAARELLGSLGIAEVGVVAHGHGGGIGQLLALDGGVRAMVLIDAIAFDGCPSEATRSLQALPPERRTQSAAQEALDRFLAKAMGHPERLAAEDRAEYRRPFTGEDGARAFFAGIDAADGIGLVGTETALAGLEVPALVLWGEEDPYLPAALGERLADALPMSTIGFLPGCSHLLPEDAPETVAPLVFEYLRSRYLGTPHTHAGGPVAVELGRRPPREEEG
jgi:pimeloyl-ACP methyl ester carboxylesterase